MKAEIWLSIDRIGNRPAARLDWETISGLPWDDLHPFFTAIHGKLAREVFDPDDPNQHLVVWDRKDDKVVLESPHIPAHRRSMEVPSPSVALFRPDMRKLSAALAPVFSFISRPTEGDGDIQKIGFVQVPGVPNVDVALLLPTTPGRARLAAQRLLTGYASRGILLLVPTAKWLAFMPAFPSTFEVKVLAEFLATEDGDSLVSVVAAGTVKPQRTKPKPAKVLQVRQDDRWEHLTATLDPADGILELRIENRSLSVELLDSGKKPTRTARILGRIIQQSPHRWTVSDLTGKMQGAMRQDFLRFKKQLMGWASVPDGDPFRYESATHSHYPRFTLALKSEKQVTRARERV